MIRSAASQELHPAVKATLVEETALGRTLPELSHDFVIQAVFMDITQTFGISFVPDLFSGDGNAARLSRSGVGTFQGGPGT